MSWHTLGQDELALYRKLKATRTVAGVVPSLLPPLQIPEAPPIPGWLKLALGISALATAGIVYASFRRKGR